jgi:hypothetical protein
MSVTDCPPEAPPSKDTAIDAVIQKIEVEKKKLDKSEGSAVESVLRIALFMRDLRKLAERDWAKKAKALGFDERVARRYVAVGESWLSETGPAGSGLAALPADVQKLEWLARLNVDQLRQLAAGMDLKNSSRSQVIAAVKKVLGLTAPVSPPGVTKAIISTTDRLLLLVRRARDEADQADQKFLREMLLVASVELEKDARALATPAEQPGCAAPSGNEAAGSAPAPPSKWSAKAFSNKRTIRV